MKGRKEGGEGRKMGGEEEESNEKPQKTAIFKPNFQLWGSCTR